MTAVNARVWSPQQLEIFRWFENSATIQSFGKKHLIVRARAGTGKTTTIIEAVNYAPEQSILLCAFNKRIAEELTSRLPSGKAQAKTLHSVGLACVKRFWTDVKVSFTSDRADDLAEKVCGAEAPDTIKRLVSKLHTKGREIAPHATAMGDLTEIAIRYECEPDESWQDDGFDLDYIEKKALAAMELAASTKPVVTGIDGSDMIFLPVRNGWLRKAYDMVVVDEAQDMTTAQLEIASGVCRGRIVVVGDDRQAIYGFRGADSESLDRLKRELDAEELPLTVTYRCAQSIVRAAAELVPDFSAGAGNPEGEIIDLSGEKLKDTAAPGDFILSRVNAPLVSIAMSLLRAGKRTRIAGRDIGSGLVTLIRKFRARSVPELLEKIKGWEEREIARLEKRFKGKADDFKGKAQAAAFTSRLDAIKDQAEMLTSLSDGARNVNEVSERIEALFTDDGLGQAGVITCSSVHRAKGLEASRVFVLRDTLRNHSQEELNIAYVAMTRAKTTLVYVIGGTR